MVTFTVTAADLRLAVVHVLDTAECHHTADLACPSCVAAALVEELAAPVLARVSEAIADIPANPHGCACFDCGLACPDCLAKAALAAMRTDDTSG